MNCFFELHSSLPQPLSIFACFTAGPLRVFIRTFSFSALVTCNVRTTMEKAHEVLKNTFGFDSFRLEQEAVRVFRPQRT